MHVANVHFDGEVEIPDVEATEMMCDDCGQPMTWWGPADNGLVFCRACDPERNFACRIRSVTLDIRELRRSWLSRLIGRITRTG
jgi:hypothetical protein